MIDTTMRYTDTNWATPSPADSHRCLRHLAHPSHALVDTPPAAHEARATAKGIVNGLSSCIEQSLTTVTGKQTRRMPSRGSRLYQRLSTRRFYSSR